MTRRTRWPALGLAIGVAGVGAYIAFVLAGGRWAPVGAVLGAVTGSFAPSVYDTLIGRGEKREAERATAERPVPQSPARLLDPRRELVEFVGREDELKALQAWCTDKEASRLRLVTGPGGVGKTRLSVELADRMRKAGWRTERVATGQEAQVIAALGDGHRSRTLLVVDYAETRAGLSQMISDLAGEHGDRVRVLLLARSAGGWWDRLAVENPAAWDLVQAAKQAVLDLAPAVSAELSDAEIITQAVRAFAVELGVPEKTVDLGGGPERRRVLDLHAAALVAVLGQANGLLVEAKAGDVLTELLRHEQHFWYDSAAAAGLTGGQAGLTQRQLRQLVAAACLLGAASEDEARALPARVPGLAPSVAIADWLRALYSPDLGAAEWIGSLQPDRLAALHAIHEITASPELAQACLTNLDARQALRAATVLARGSWDYPEAEDLLCQILPDATNLIAAMPASGEALTVIFNAIPWPPVVLAPAAVLLCQRILGLLPTDADPEIRAGWLGILGSCYSALGRPANALIAEQEAVIIYRDLAAASPDRYRPDLADALSNLGATYPQLGRPADGLPFAEESVALYRELAATSPDRYRLDLANALSNLGVRYSELGCPADAVQVTEEAVVICRELAAVSPDQYRPDLARILSNLGATYPQLGRPADGLPFAEESVALYRELAAVSPDQYRPDLDDSLYNLGELYALLGSPTDGLPYAEEPVALYRELAVVSPDQYRPDLADALSNLGAWYSALGSPTDGLPYAEESVALYRELAAALPDRYRPDLAESLTNLGTILSALGRPADGLPPAEESVALYRELAAALPDRYPDPFRPGLAEALDNLGARLSEVNRLADALPVTDEAVAIRRELVGAGQDRYRPDLVRSLATLAALYEELGHAAEAVAAREEAARVEDMRA